MAINADRPDADDGVVAGVIVPADDAAGEASAPDSELDDAGAEDDAAAQALADAQARAADVEALVEAGDYALAARAARLQGDPGRAVELYERIWDFASAAECACEAGDAARALQNAIDARDEPLTLTMAEELESAGEDGQRAALAVFARKRRFAEAGHLAEALEQWEDAIEHFKRAHLELHAARLLSRVGRDREAGRLLERFVKLGPPGDDRARAQLALGIILARRMNHQAAARYLQEAARHDDSRAQAQRALVVTLAAMGLRDAARDVLVAARADDPELPADIDSFVRKERDALRAQRASADQAGGGDGERAHQQMIGGRYQLGELIGAGGAGRVFEASDEVSARACAVKVFHTSHSRGNQAYERFVREAKLASSLKHPNLVEVYDFSADQGYMVMELMSGSLLDRLADGPMAERAVRRLAVDILAGLELAHQRGVIHRDVKPANVFFDARGTAKLGDFGVAHLIDLGQTQTGGLIGTLAYMSPEQITGAPLSITADLYSLGVTLFEALTGRLPFLGPDFVAQHLGETAPAPSTIAIAGGPEPGADIHTDSSEAGERFVQTAWDPILGQLLTKNPGERFSSIEGVRRRILDMDLGAENQPRVLMLHRAGTKDGGRDSTAGGRGQGGMGDLSALGLMTPTAKDGAGDGPDADPDTDDGEDDAPRYQYETPLGTTEISRLSRAVDTVLERSVIIESYREGALDAATERRLYALARGGGPFVQRALSYDKAHGVAVFEAPSGTPVSEAFAAERLGARRLARLLKRLARALAPLHENANAHGAITAHTVVVDDEFNPTLLVCGLGRAEDSASPAGDVQAVLQLLLNAWHGPENGPASGLESLTAQLVDAMVPTLADEERRALTPASSPASGEALYRFADAVEIALLRTAPTG